LSNKVVNRLVKKLQEKKLTLALGESVTCGMAAHQLNTVKGTEDVFMGSFVCYHPDTKIRTLHIPRKTIKKYTCESRQVTDAVAKSLSRFFNADIYAAITGLANAGGSESKTKPVGTIFISALYKNKMYRKRKIFKGTPMNIKKRACETLFTLLLNIIKA
jgi:nicotinamide-nucleotide amidase